MLRILLTASDGGTAWRHALASGEARAGWECVGPLGLAKRLGRLYGLRGEPAPHAERVSAYAARLARLEAQGPRAFSRSRAKDPWGVAAFLLGLRDALRAGGWDGGALDGSPRLADVAAAERLDAPGLGPLPPGLADVFADLLAELERSTSVPEPLAIRIAAPEAAIDPIVRRVLVALATRGADVLPEDEPSPAAPAGTDLGRLQRALRAPPSDAPAAPLAGDGTVVVLEADTALEAAELAASVLRRRPLADATLVAGGDARALELALARHGLPAIGAGERSRWRPALQVLPLRLALAFEPRDPFRAAELLMLPVTPVPADARRRLLEALVEQPGVGGPAWRDAVEAAVGHAAARARAEAPPGAGAAAAEAEAHLRDRIETWFGGPAWDPREGIPAPDAIRLCDAVARWAEARARFEDAPDPGLQAAARIARTLARMLAEQPAGTRLPAVQLEQLHDVAAGDGLDAGAVGEAGRAALALDPAGVLPGAREVVWWGFLAGGRGAAPDPWTAAERDALARRGVTLPAPGARRGAEASGWRRPVLAASERLVLVRWRLDGAEPTVPHPLTDELAARVADALASCTVTSEAALAGRAPRLGAAVSPRAPAPPLAPRPVFHLPEDTVTIGALSPSSLEKLLGCPVAWVLERAAGLRRRGMARIPTGNRLLGTFAHAILADLLDGPEKLDLATATPEDAETWAGRAFDARVATEAAPLVARGADVERHRARGVVSGAALALFQALQAGGWRVRATEAQLEGRLDGSALAGSADLVLEKDGAPAILDLKLATSEKYFREKLESGEALQLAMYAELVRNGTMPPTGYFLLGQGELLTVDAGAFPGARELTGPSMAETVDAARDALTFWRAALAKGVAVVRDEGRREAALLEAADAAGRPPPTNGPGAAEPPCRFCDFGTVCRASLQEVAR